MTDRSHALPWWGHAALLTVLVLDFVLHGHAAFIDAPLAHLGPFTVTLFEVLFIVSFSVEAFFVNSLIDSFFELLSASAWLVVVKIVLVVGGVLFFLQVALYAMGFDNVNLSAEVAHSVASIFHPTKTT